MIDETTLKADAERCWNSKDSSGLRAEFDNNFDRYHQYRRAVAQGSVRMLGSDIGADGELKPRGAGVVR